MSNTELAKDIIDRLPPNTSLHEMARKIEFVASVQEGFDQIDAGKGVNLDHVEQMIDLWTTK
jgi:hypothetical protein